MTDPYQILGVSPHASDDEIKTAYRKLSQQYHPDRQNDSVMEEIATEKMAEINAAYDEIMNMRRNNTAQTTNSQSASGSYDFYSQVRTQIQQGNYTAADEMLEKNRNNGNAEWNFLKGTVCLSRGWMSDAHSYFSNAVRLEPSNREYQMAFSQMNNKRSGQMYGNPYQQQNRTDNTLNTLCNICQCMICADCLCDCI